MIIMENELRKAMRQVIDAEIAVKAWKEEVSKLKKDFKKLMDAATAAASVTGATFDRVTESDRIRAAVLEEIEMENATTEPSDPDGYLAREVMGEEEARSMVEAAMEFNPSTEDQEDGPRYQANDPEDQEDEDEPLELLSTVLEE